ncbi:hypothetical protein HPP92_006721 [Vanilla planifolia]|uniref:Uncharacterized protein n=1 Tax=Vanilla planifolia TaxID=51239 RepID=A0A835R959_VANPL|nr:hypothetical protein HPP92_006721 [Vanilla planifolia]
MEKVVSFAGGGTGAPGSFPDVLSELLDTVEEIAAGVLYPAIPLLGCLKPILLELRNRESAVSEPIREVLDSLRAVLQRSLALVKKATGSSVSTIDLIEESVHDIGRCLGLLVLAWADAPMEVKEAMIALQREMMAAELHPVRRVENTATRPGGGGGGDIVLDIDDMVIRIKKGAEDELETALSEVGMLIDKGLVGEEDVGDVIHAIVRRLGSAKNGCRLRIIFLMRKLAELSDDTKEMMSTTEALSGIVKSMSRDVDESREAVALLLRLANMPKVRQKIGRVQGCIMILVTLLNGADASASLNASKLLAALSSKTQNVLLMAESGYYTPLVHYLKEGSDMKKVLMATAISRIELTDQMKATLVKEGSIEPLVKMFISSKIEAKFSSLNALKNLSSSKENIECLINSGILSPLLQILLSITSGLTALREPASALLATLARSQSILSERNAAQQMLSVLHLSSPEIQLNLLHALNSIADHSRAKSIRTKMKESGVMQLVMPFLVVSDDEIRIAALSLQFTFSTYFMEDLMSQFGYSNLIVLVNIIYTSTSEKEMASAIGIISNIPSSDKEATQILESTNLLPFLVPLAEQLVTASITPEKKWLLEGIAGIMVRFTVPSVKKLQKISASHGLVPCLVKLLSCNSIVAKSRAATSLAQLSQSTISLVKTNSSRWFCVSPTAEKLCVVHNGHCLVKSTFCLVMAGALTPLVQILDDKEREADEAVLEALSTLLEDAIWAGGCNAIEQASGVQAILRILQVGSLKAQEKAVWMLERIFRLETNRSKHGKEARHLLVDLACRDSILKPMIAKILAHLQLPEMQPSFF